jgi:hypothetical protein
LVEPTQQREVRERLSHHKLLGPRNVRHDYLLRTWVVCGQCGLRMTCERRTRSHHPYEYFYYVYRGPSGDSRATRSNR